MRPEPSLGPLRGGCGGDLRRDEAVLHGEGWGREARGSRGHVHGRPDYLPGRSDEGKVGPDRTRRPRRQQRLHLRLLLAGHVAVGHGCFVVRRIAGAAVALLHGGVGYAADGRRELHLSGHDEVDGGALEEARVGAAVAGQESAAAARVGAGPAEKSASAAGRGGSYLAEASRVSKALVSVSALQDQVQDEDDDDGEHYDHGSPEAEDVLHLQ